MSFPKPCDSSIIICLHVNTNSILLHTSHFTFYSYIKDIQGTIFNESYLTFDGKKGKNFFKKTKTKNSVPEGDNGSDVMSPH